MKQIEVVAAIIQRPSACSGTEIFCTQRGYGEWKDWWEFPGGKIEPNEDPIQALKREIREELASEINVGEELIKVNYDYPDFHLTMHCFLCSLTSGELTLLEHEDSQWLSKEELDNVKWLPADKEIIELLKQR